MSTCYNCKYWNGKSTDSVAICEKRNSQRKASDRICDFFDSIPCCATCKYLLGTVCELGHIDFSESTKKPSDTICKNDDYTPLNNSFSPSSGSSSSGSSSSSSRGGGYGCLILILIIAMCIPTVREFFFSIFK